MNHLLGAVVVWPWVEGRERLLSVDRKGESLSADGVPRSDGDYTEELRRQRQSGPRDPNGTKSNQSSDGKTDGKRTCRQQPNRSQRNQSIKQSNCVQKVANRFNR